MRKYSYRPDRVICGAYARTTGKLCQRSPLRGRTRCRLHGGRNPGAPRGNQYPLKHGRYTAEAEAARRAAAALRREAKAAIAAALAPAEAVMKRPVGRPKKVREPESS